VQTLASSTPWSAGGRGSSLLPGCRSIVGRGWVILGRRFVLGHRTEDTVLPAPVQDRYPREMFEVQQNTRPSGLRMRSPATGTIDHRMHSLPLADARSRVY
jgi:hypothetical protein